MLKVLQDYNTFAFYVMEITALIFYKHSREEALQIKWITNKKSNCMYCNIKWTHIT